MIELQVFDQPLCCSTGICGPEVDPVLVRFAADLQWLQRQGVTVQRVNPAQQPAVFAANTLVREELKQHGNGCLPLVVVNKSVVSRGIIPNRMQLCLWTGLPPNVLPELPVMKSGCCSEPGGSTDSTSCC